MRENRIQGGFLYICLKTNNKTSRLKLNELLLLLKDILNGIYKNTHSQVQIPV